VRVTNKLGLPEAIVRAVTPRRTRAERRGYSDYSVTELVGPAYVKALRDWADDLIEVDVADMVPAIIGTAVHLLIHQNAEGQAKTASELRLFADIDGSRVSGQFDLTEDGRLVDVKVCRVMAITDGAKPEWEAQVNSYAHLMRANGMGDPKSLEIVAFLRDWSRAQYFRERDTYPPHEVQRIRVEKWLPARCEAYIRGRLAEHRKPELCNQLERWTRKAGFAVMPINGKRARRAGFTNKEQAEYWISEYTKSHPNSRFYIEYRAGEDVRCMNYCEVWRWCPHGQKVKGVNDAPS